MKKTKIKKIGIFGYFGAGNLGDEAVVDILIENIRKRIPDAELSAICLVPDDAARHHKIPAIPLRRMPKEEVSSPPGEFKNEQSDAFSWSGLMKGILRRLSIIAPSELVFLIQSYRKMKGFDMIVVGGSGQLIDNEGGIFNHPYNHFKWTLLAKIVGAQFVFLSVGAGPLLTRPGKWFIQRSLSMGSYRSFRDEYSKNLAVQIGVKGENYIFPDQAFCIRIPAPRPAQEKKEKQIVVGIAPIAYCDPRHWSESKVEAYKAYVEKMAEFTRWIIEQGQKIVFFHTQVNGDDRVIDEIIQKIPSSFSEKQKESVEIHPVQWYPDALEAIMKTDVVVVSRFHAVIFAYVLNKPVVAISYDKKINNVMSAAGQGDYAVNIEQFDVDELKNIFGKMISCVPENKTHIYEKTKDFQNQIQRQYDHVFGMEGA